MWAVRSARLRKLCPHHIHFKICLVCSSPLPSHTSWPRTSFLGGWLCPPLFDPVFVLLLPLVLTCPFPLPGSLPCLATFRWAVSEDNVENCSWHHTHRNTSLVHEVEVMLVIADDVDDVDAACVAFVDEWDSGGIGGGTREAVGEDAPQNKLGERVCELGGLPNNSQLSSWNHTK